MRELVPLDLKRKCCLWPHLMPTVASPNRLGNLTVHFGSAGHASFLSIPITRGRLR